MAKERFITFQEGGPTAVVDWTVAGELYAIEELRKDGKDIELLLSKNGAGGILYANVPENIVSLRDTAYTEFMFAGPGATGGTIRLGKKVKGIEAIINKIVTNILALNITGIGPIGGNDTAWMGQKIEQSIDSILGDSGVKKVGVIHGIKTVDNDLPKTDICPGYISATYFNILALVNTFYDFKSYGMKGNVMLPDRSIKKDTWGLVPFMIYQAMGRKAAYLAEGTGLAKVDPKGELDPERAPHIILSKANPVNMDEVYAETEKVLKKQGKVAFVVQEDLTDAKTGLSWEKAYAEKTQADEAGHVQHGRAGSFSPAQQLAYMLTNEFKMESFYGKLKDCIIAPQHMQRAFAVTYDQQLAFQVGYAMIMALAEGFSGKSVILKREDTLFTTVFNTEFTDINSIADKDKQMPTEFIDGIKGPTQEFVDQHLWMIGGAPAIPHYHKPRTTSITIPQSILDKPYAEPKKTK